MSALGWVAIGILVVIWLAAAVTAAGHAVMYKRDPRSSAIWATISLTLPLVGPALYWAMGVNRVERHAVRRLGRRDRPFDAIRSADPAARREAVGHLSRLQAVSDSVTRLPLLPGNSITPLHNGECTYPRMLAAIAGAEQSVNLASYIFDWDDVGREIVRALDEAARRGVRVHLLVDGIGALGTLSRMGRLLIKSGAEVAYFFPLRFPFGRIRINLRNHRKLLVVDGRTGFTGGMNISARHLAGRDEPNRVEDVHFEITGPVVAEMQHTFVEDWALATGEVLEGPDYFPELPATGPSLCRGIASGPDEDFEIIHWQLLAAFGAAERSVRIATPYFVPTSPLVSAMSMAALRGVDIALLLPSVVDHAYMRWAADAYLWQLLEHGIRVYHRPPPFVHSKLLIVDERWLLLGSANLDNRSFRLNFEFNIEAYDPDLAAQLAAQMDAWAERSRQVTLDEMDSRPTWRRLRDGAAKVFSPYL